MINEQIRDREVRLIGPDGTQLGIVSSREALAKAQEAGLDLVKIAAQAKPPVCKIIDYGKYRYELARKEKEAQEAGRETGRRIARRPQFRWSRSPDPGTP
jgi:translation initiation factor IF-3